MAKTILLKNNNTNKLKVGIIGFSWVFLFFGIFVSLFRKDWKTFLMLLIFYSVSVTIMIFYSQYTLTQDMNSWSFNMEPTEFMISTIRDINFICVNFLGALFYNKIYTQKLLKKGFMPTNQHEADFLMKEGFVLSKLFDEDLV